MPVIRQGNYRRLYEHSPPHWHVSTHSFSLATSKLNGKLRAPSTAKTPGSTYEISDSRQLVFLWTLQDRVSPPQLVSTALTGNTWGNKAARRRDEAMKKPFASLRPSTDRGEMIPRVELSAADHNCALWAGNISTIFICNSNLTFLSCPLGLLKIKYIPL